jgi:hypothetical protein
VGHVVAPACVTCAGAGALVLVFGGRDVPRLSWSRSLLNQPMSPISSVLKLSTNDSAIAVGELAPVGLDEDRRRELEAGRQPGCARRSG